MSDGMVKGLSIAGSVILILIVIAAAFDATNKSMDIEDKAMSKVEEQMGDMLDYDKTIYDGNEVLGSEVLNAISKFKNKEFGVLVCTKKNTSGTWYGYNLTSSGDVYSFGSQSTAVIANAKKVSNNEYINTSAYFLGELLYDANGEIIGVKFTQQ